MSELPGVTLITPTGRRQQALDLCTGFVTRQTWAGPVQWILVDDGEPASELDPGLGSLPNLTVRAVYPEPPWAAGQNTLARNLLAAIPLVSHPFVLFIEDDDWIASDYVEGQMAQLLDGADIVGEAQARYYHILTEQYRIMPGGAHASLCQTGIRSTVLPLLQQVCKESNTFIDVRLWARVIGAKKLYDGSRSVGIKGLPGRPGIGIGHRPQTNGGQWRRDRDLAMLVSWVGAEDAAVYRSFTAREYERQQRELRKRNRNFLLERPKALPVP